MGRSHNGQVSMRQLKTTNSGLFRYGGPIRHRRFRRDRLSKSRTLGGKVYQAGDHRVGLRLCVLGRQL